MSALAGIVRLNRAPVTQDQLERMAQSVAYIETDSVSRWRHAEVGLLHFKLATTPEALDEVQPLEDRESGLVVMIDGRLDNRDELLRLLGPAGGLDRHAGDCAIVLQLYKRFGQECTRHLVGDYTLAVWERQRHVFFCARSPLGWRPFLWYADATTFAFATEPRALVDGLALPRRLNEGVLGEFLASRFVAQTETLWQNIQRLPPGSAIEVCEGKLRQWHWHRHVETEGVADEDDAAHRFLQHFDEGLLACMRSSTEVAAHLSGGLDSSSVICRAEQLYQAGSAPRRLHPFSVRYFGESHDEGEWIEAVEAQAGLTSHTISPGGYDWDRARAWCEETLQLPLRPNVLGTCIGTYNQVRNLGMRVLLTGEGGDDWLRGSQAHWPDLLRQGRLRQLWREAVTLGSGPSQLRRIARMVRNSVGPLAFSSYRDRVLRPYFQFSHETPSWLRPEWAGRIGLRERWQADEAPVNFASLARQERFRRYTFARPHVNVDNVLTLAAKKGVELRHPFHDLRLTRYLVNMPGDLLLRGTERKYLLRRAMRGILPEKVRCRPDKGDLSKPIIDALETYFSEVKVKDLLCVQAGWVDPAPIARAYEDNLAWYRGGCKGPWPEMPLNPVWPVVAADIWLKHALKV